MTNLHQVPESIAPDTAQPASIKAQDSPCQASISSSAKKPCHAEQMIAGTKSAGTSLSTRSDGSKFEPAPKPMSRPVRLRGRMTADGYEPENWAWREVLTYIDEEGRRVGRDPMSIPPEVLTAAGHAPRRTKGIVRALGDDPVDPSIFRHKDLRRHCLSCAESPGEVRRCAIINCPLWHCRMGHNPHNPQRGRNPFATRSPYHEAQASLDNKASRDH